MSLYYRGTEIREIDDALYAAWVAAGNPKASDWTLAPVPPYETGCTWNGTQWIVASDAELIAAIVSQIKQSARAHILATLPEWKQTNMAARAIELTRIQLAGGTLSPTESAALESAWAWVKTVRAASDAAEAALPAMTREQLNAWTEPTWPVFGA